MRVTVSFEIDCSRAFAVLVAAGVPETPETLAKYIESKVQALLMRGNLPGTMHTDPRNGLPEVTVTVAQPGATGHGG